MHNEVRTTSTEVTQLLKAWGNGDAAALDQLVPLVNSELRRLARHYLRHERSDPLLQTTVLVNEAWVRLLDGPDVNWQNRAHFIGLAATLMRRILVDEARRRRALKHGGEALRISLTDVAAQFQQHSPDLLALDDALNTLAQLDPRRSRIVELRFFGGLSVEETAEVLKVSVRTVAREWSLAQAWLYRELNRET